MPLDRRSFFGLAAGIGGIAWILPAGFAEAAAAPLRPEDFGATGGRDDTAAIQRLADAAASRGYAIDGGGRSYNVDNVMWPSHTRLSNIRLVLNPGDRDDRSPVAIGQRGRVTRDLVFDRVVVDGNRQRQEAVGRSGYADGARSGFQIKGAVDGVTIRNCTAVNCATDGIMIFSDLQQGADDSYILRNILLSGVVSVGNRRHGLSADAFQHLRILRCRLNGNGKDLMPGTPIDHGSSGARHNGALYGRPFDIEDYLVGTGWADLTIEETDCRGNTTGGLVYSPVSPESAGFVPRRNVRIVRCLFDELGGSRWDPPLGVAQAVDYRGTRPTFVNVRLIDNVFDHGPLRLSGIDGLVVRGGRISVTKKNETQPIIAMNCRTVSIDL
jgi:hypothetical protein